MGALSQYDFSVIDRMQQRKFDNADFERLYKRPQPTGWETSRNKTPQELEAARASLHANAPAQTTMAPLTDAQFAEARREHARRCQEQAKAQANCDHSKFSAFDVFSSDQPASVDYERGLSSVYEAPLIDQEHIHVRPRTVAEILAERDRLVLPPPLSSGPKPPVRVERPQHLEQVVYERPAIPGMTPAVERQHAPAPPPSSQPMRTGYGQPSSHSQPFPVPMQRRRV